MRPVGDPRSQVYCSISHIQRKDLPRDRLLHTRYAGARNGANVRDLLVYPGPEDGGDGGTLPLQAHFTI